MSVRHIIQYPAEVLTTPAAKVSAITKEVTDLVDDMIATMREFKGVGLAAPQVGIPLRITVLEYEADERAPDLDSVSLQVLINPKIISRTGGQDEEKEGCLSLPGIEVPVKRYRKIKVRALDREGNQTQFRASGFWARIIQHEVDHLGGTLIIDHAKSLKKILAQYEQRKNVGTQSLL